MFPSSDLADIAGTGIERINIIRLRGDLIVTQFNSVFGV